MVVSGNIFAILSYEYKNSFRNRLMFVMVLKEFDKPLGESNTTRGPMGHILDTTMRCFRAIIVQLPNKGKFAKLNTNLEKYLHHLMEHFLIIMMRVQYKCLYSSQSCCLEGTHLIFYALKYTYHLILMALKQTNKTNMAQNGHKLEKLYLNRTKI